MPDSLDEFDTSTYSGVIYPLASKKLIYSTVNRLAPSFLICCSSFLQITRTTKFRMNSKFGQIQPWAAAFERLKFYFLLEDYLKYFMTCLLLDERSLPFGLLVFLVFFFFSSFFFIIGMTTKAIGYNTLII